MAWVGVTSYVEQQILEIHTMEVAGFETDKDRGLGRLKCLSCSRWVRFADLKLVGLDDLDEVPCPNCGDTGAEFRAKREVGKRAYEDWRTHSKP